MKISLLVPIIDPLIVNKFTDIPLWYICNYFSLRDMVKLFTVGA